MQYQYQMPKTLLMHIVDTSTNSSKYLENSKSQMQRRYDDSCGPTGQWIIIYVAQISNDDSCGRARCHQLYFCHWQSALCHAATLLGGTYFSVKIPQLAAHLVLGKSPLFDCVCFSKPNPPAGEDLRDSHQHYDRPPPPPPHHQTYSNICSLMGGEEDILYDLNIQSLIQSLFKLSSQIKL